MRLFNRLLLQLTLITLLLFEVPIEPGSGAPSPTIDVCLAHSGQITVMTVPSAVYEHSIQVSVYLPPCYASSDASSTELLPVVYLLHGGGADETQWPDLRVQAEADTLIASGAQPFVAVMPSGNYPPGLDYAAFVLDDLIPAMNDRLHIRTDPAGRAIGGLSLGGYWALSVAFHHPDQFTAVGGYSPVVASTSDDLVGLARTAIGLDQLRIELDAGDTDPLAADAQQLAAALRARGLSVSLTIKPGGHDRPYWRTRTHDYLSFMLASFTSPVHGSTCHSESRIEIQ
jgi:enterochelin esterase-like enzyme